MSQRIDTAPLVLHVPLEQGAGLVAGFWLIFIVFFVSLAMRNLLDGTAMVASALLLLLVGWVFVASWYDAGGFRALLVARLGHFASARFVDTVAAPGGGSTVRIACRVLGLTVIEHVMATEQVTQVEIRSGQYSHLAGRDLDDWTVDLWFHREAAAESDEGRTDADLDLVILGTRTAKPGAEALGSELVSFLRAAGVTMEQVPCDPHTFKRAA